MSKISRRQALNHLSKLSKKQPQIVGLLIPFIYIQKKELISLMQHGADDIGEEMAPVKKKNLEINEFSKRLHRITE